MAKRLLDRQASLLEYLTSGAAIFGDSDGRDRSLGACKGSTAGCSVSRRASRIEKRMEKIAAVFPRTFELLGTSARTLIAGIRRCLPAGRTSAAWQRAAVPRFSVRALAAQAPQARLSAATSRPASLRARRSVPASIDARRFDAAAGWRRAAPRPPPPRRGPPALQLMTSGSIFEDGAAGGAPEPSATRRSRSHMPAGADQPRVFEIAAASSSTCWRRSTTGPIRPSSADTGARRHSSASSRSTGSSRWAREDLHHRQVSADPGRRQHADLLDRACARGSAATRSTSSPTPRRCARRSACTCGPQDWRAARHGTAPARSTVHWTDPVDRSQSYIPMASPFVSKLAAIAAQRARRAPVRRHLFALSGALWRGRPSRRADDRRAARGAHGRKRCRPPLAPSAIRGAVRSRAAFRRAA